MRKIILTFVVFTLLAACAAPPAPSDTATTVPEATETAASIPAAESDPAEPTVAATEPQPIPTSRGDALAASNPALVNLNPGRPVLVEFFRFT